VLAVQRLLTLEAVAEAEVVAEVQEVIHCLPQNMAAAAADVVSRSLLRAQVLGRLSRRLTGAVARLVLQEQQVYMGVLVPLWVSPDMQRHNRHSHFSGGLRSAQSELIHFRLLI
jgi:hypothetical protein